MSITGGIFKSTLWVTTFFVGSILGGTSIGSLTLLVDYLNKKGVLAFEMKFWIIFLPI